MKTFEADIFNNFLNSLDRDLARMALIPLVHSASGRTLAIQLLAKHYPDELLEELRKEELRKCPFTPSMAGTPQDRFLIELVRLEKDAMVNLATIRHAIDKHLNPERIDAPEQQPAARAARLFAVPRKRSRQRSSDKR